MWIENVQVEIISIKRGFEASEIKDHCQLSRYLKDSYREKSEAQRFSGWKLGEGLMVSILHWKSY